VQRFLGRRRIIGRWGRFLNEGKKGHLFDWEKRTGSSQLGRHGFPWGKKGKKGKEEQRVWKRRTAFIRKSRAYFFAVFYHYDKGERNGVDGGDIPLAGRREKKKAGIGTTAVGRREGTGLTI